MRDFTLLALLAVFLASSNAGPLRAQAADETGRPDLAVALRAADVAEVYLIRRDLSFVTAPDPGTVRTLGCRYVVRRNSAAWRELEAAIRDVDIWSVVAGEAQRGEMRVGLMLGDGRGLLFEGYARWPAPGETRVPGLARRRSVTFPAGFAAALDAFAVRHRDLAIPVASPIPVCPAPA
jgi:hypothetical protein